jgi:hypothetical protein
MALSIRRAAAWLYLRRIADWIAQKLYLELMNKTVLGLHYYFDVFSNQRNSRFCDAAK